MNESNINIHVMKNIVYMNIRTYYNLFSVNKTTAMPALPDSEYLARAIGSALTQALAEVCDRRPWDPIDYLSNWLRKYADNSRYKREVS